MKKYPEVELLVDIFDVNQLTPEQYERLGFFFDESDSKEKFKTVVRAILDDKQFAILSSFYGLFDGVVKTAETVASIQSAPCDNIVRIKNLAMETLKDISNKNRIKDVLQSKSDVLSIRCPDCGTKTLMLSGRMPNGNDTNLKLVYESADRASETNFAKLYFCPKCYKILADDATRQRIDSFITACSMY